MLSFHYAYRKPPVPPIHQGTEYFVSPTGQASGTGTSDAPWNLATALTSGAPRGGDTVTLLAGTYGTGVEQYAPTLAGSPAQPITVRGQPGARVTINCQNFAPEAACQYVWFRDFEIYCGDTTTAYPNDITLLDLDSAGDGIKLINLVVHDSWGDAVNIQNENADHEAYGVIIYNAGGGLASPFGHGLYCHGTTIGAASRKLRQSILTNCVGYGLHCFSSSGNLANFDIEQVAAFTNGLGLGYDFLVGGVQPLANLTCVNNVVLRADGNTCATIGYWSSEGGQNTSGVVTDNYFAGLLYVQSWEAGSALTFERNTMVQSGVQTLKLVYQGAASSTGWSWDANTYATDQNTYGLFEIDQDVASSEVATSYDTLADWQSASGVDASSTYTQTASGALGAKSWCWANAYTPGRGHVIVHNPDSLASVAVDVSAVLAPNDTFALYHVYDLWGTPVLSGTYTGAAISVPMTGTGKTPPAVIQRNGGPAYTPVNALPTIGAFVLVKTGTAAGFNPHAIPHSSTGLWFQYTDFSTPYQSASAAATQQAFINTHVDTVMSGGEPAGGYQTGLVHDPYCLLEEVKCYGESWGNVLTGDASDFSAYCTAHGYDEEDGYIHYVAGQTMFADAVTSINGAAGTVTLQYDTQGAAKVYAAGNTVTIAGNSVAAFNGSWTVSSVTPGVWSQGSFGSGTLTTGTVLTIPALTVASTSTGTGGTVTRVATGAKATENRMRKQTGTFSPMWHIAPATTARRAYEIDRLQRILAGTYTSFVPEGVFFDSMTPTEFPAGVATLEYNPANSAQFFSDMAGLLAGMKNAVGNAPFRVQVNTASYATAQADQIVNAAGSYHGESILGIKTAGYWPGANQTDVVNRMALGTYGVILNDDTPADNLSSWGAGTYVNDPVPGTIKSAANVRFMAACFCVALGIVDPLNEPNRLALNLWNGLWTTPTADTGGIDQKWIGLLEVDLGHPTGPQTLAFSGVNDALGQAVKIYTRPFQRGLVVYRYTATTVTSASAYTWTLPTSSATSGLWQRVKSDGSLDSPLGAIALSAMEGVILVPDTTGGTTTPSVTLAPSSTSATVGGTATLTATVTQGAPVSGASVSATSSNTGVATVTSSATTNASGQAALTVTGVAAGTASVTATALGVTSTPTSVTVNAVSGGATKADWFQASSVTGLAAGASVTAWPNDADNTRAASAGTVAPTYQASLANGQPAVKYDGSRADLGFTSQSHTAVTAFAVVYFTGFAGSTGFGRILADPANEWNLVEGTTNAAIRWISNRGTTNGQWVTATNVCPANQAVLLTVLYDSSSTANAPTIKLNGAAQTLTQQSVPAGAQASGAGQGYLGCKSNNFAFAGSVLEVTRFDGLLSASDEATEGRRLATRYGLTTAY